MLGGVAGVAPWGVSLGETRLTDSKLASAPKSLMGLIEKGGGTSVVSRRWGQTSRAMSGTSVADESLRARAPGVGTPVSGARVFGLARPVSTA